MKFSPLNVDFSSPSFDPPSLYVQWGLHMRVSKKVKETYTLKVIIFPLLACLVWKRLQIGTDMLLIITSSGDVLLVVLISMTLNDFEPQK